MHTALHRSAAARASRCVLAGKPISAMLKQDKLMFPQCFHHHSDDSRLDNYIFKPLLLSFLDMQEETLTASLPPTSVQVSCYALCHWAQRYLSRESSVPSLLLEMCEGERDHCHSISAIFNLISSQNFICQLNHCRQTLQRWEVGEKKRGKQIKKGPLVAVGIFYLFFGSVYFSISYMPKFRFKKNYESMQSCH